MGERQHVPTTAFQRAMAGATKDYKAGLDAQVTPAVAKEIRLVAQRIIQGLPGDVPLGTLAAGLMLAATAYAEGASHADLVIQQAFGLEPEDGG